MKSHVLPEHYCKALKLPTVLREFGRLARECAQKNRGYGAFLESLLELEVQKRAERSVERRLKEAGFPTEKELSAIQTMAGRRRDPCLPRTRLWPASSSFRPGKRNAEQESTSTASAPTEPALTKCSLEPLQKKKSYGHSRTAGMSATFGYSVAGQMKTYAPPLDNNAESKGI